MRKFTHPLALTLALAAAACGAEPETAPAPSVGSGGHALSTLGFNPPVCPTPGDFTCGFREPPLPSPLAEACPSTDWVGYMITPPYATCPAARRGLLGTWQASKLFPVGAPGQPIELERFCVYQWVPRPFYSGPPLIHLLPNTAAMRLERDCNAVSPQFVPGSGAAQIFQDSYAQLMDLPEWTSAGGFPSNTRVRVAVVDDAPTEVTTQLPAQGGDGHGFLVGALARETSCLRAAGQTGDCAAQIMSYQGLPRGDDVASYGRPTDVALAMARALSDWVASGTQDKLILNLSLGWDARYSGHYGPDIRISVLAPYLVAQWAVCEGALVVAAAGNRSQVGGSAGPMFPAGWEEADRFCPGPPNTYSPLVHAAGGVDARDNVLRLARPGATPRLVLPSAFVTATAPDTASQDRQGRLTSGTSLAAAGLSGTAALVWAMKPTLTADEAIQEVYRAAVPFPDDAEFSNWSGQRQARVDVCEAVMRVCAPGSCPMACTPRPYQSDDRPDYAAAADLELPGVAAGPYTPGVGVTFFPVVPPRDEINVSPYAGPQPGGDLCPVCGFQANNLVGQLVLPPDTAVVDVFLRVTPCDGVACDPDLEGFKLDLPNATDPFKIDLSGLVDSATLDTAVLEVVTDTDGKLVARSAELYIDP